MCETDNEREYAKFGGDIAFLFLAIGRKVEEGDVPPSGHGLISSTLHPIAFMKTLLLHLGVLAMGALAHSTCPKAKIILQVYYLTHFTTMGNIISLLSRGFVNH